MDDDDRLKLDFTSEKFDATLVLNSTEVVLPFPDAETFETVSDYQKIVEKNMDPKKKRERQDRLKAMTLQQEEKKLRDENTVPRSQRNVFTFMEKSASTGPLGVLVKCMNERIKVKVWTRNYKYIRGICTGFIEAFDKHWNLALSDVDESFVKYNKAKSPATGENMETITARTEKLDLQCAQIGSVCVKKNAKLKTFQRNLNKLFIRGDNIVLISILRL
uniref:Sm domain-containing protein n=1 Tax=Strigamia maritima TaxID=126957 RepID=T1JNS2_STRMM